MRILKRVGVIMLLFSLSSCLEVDCEANKNLVLAVECLQILEKKPSTSAYNMNSEGTHLVTGRKCNCKDETRWINNYKGLLEIGDTIIKRTGELTFSFHKQDTIIEVNWRCGEPDDYKIMIKGEVEDHLTMAQLRKLKKKD
ncbi:hypothetical protein [Myroides odoratus]|nr:hypothetical protein [Myroides odoratus]MCS4239711.1 hypothetical protein [Myroides odoratus]